MRGAFSIISAAQYSPYSAWQQSTPCPRQSCAEASRFSTFTALLSRCCSASPRSWRPVPAQPCVRVCQTGKAEFTGALGLPCQEWQWSEETKQNGGKPGWRTEQHLVFPHRGAVHWSFSHLCTLEKGMAELWEPNFSFPYTSRIKKVFS